MNEQQKLELAPIDPEIERTFRKRRRELQAQTSSNMEGNRADDIRAQPVFEEDVGEANDASNALNATNAIIMADDRERAIREYAAPMFNELNPGIVRPDIQAATFELKPVMFQMLQTVGQFSGLPTKDPHLHLRSFLGVSDFQVARRF